jgi:hypothetical protein
MSGHRHREAVFHRLGPIDILANSHKLGEASLRRRGLPFSGDDAQKDGRVL